MFNYANKHRVAQRARWCELAKSYTLKWYSGNLQESRIFPKIGSDGRLCRASAFTAVGWERGEKSLQLCCPGTQGRTKEIIKGRGHRVHIVERRSPCSVIRYAITVTLINFRWINTSQISISEWCRRKTILNCHIFYSRFCLVLFPWNVNKLLSPNVWQLTYCKEN